VRRGPAVKAGVSAETPAAAEPAPGHPADPARCHVEDGPALSVSTAQMLGCTAVLSWMRHDRSGPPAGSARCSGGPAGGAVLDTAV